MKRKRGDIVLKILDTVADAALTVPAIIGGILDAGYGASISHMEYSIQKASSVDDFRAAREQRRRRYQRFSMMLRYLRKNGLVKERRVGDYVKLYLTSKGWIKLKNLREETKRQQLPLSHYTASPGKKIVIATYDIPVTLNRYRSWLREVLKRIGFKKLQKSVWVGRVKIPDELLSDLMKYKLEEYVEIVEVSSSGMMRELI